MLQVLLQLAIHVDCLLALELDNHNLRLADLALEVQHLLLEDLVLEVPRDNLRLVHVPREGHSQIPQEALLDLEVRKLARKLARVRLESPAAPAC